MRSWITPFFFFLLYGFFLLAGLRILAPFAGSLLCAVSIGIVFNPMHDWLAAKMPKRSAFWPAILSDLIVLLFFVVPIGLVVWAVAVEANALLPDLRGGIDHAILWLKGNPANGPWVQHVPAVFRQQLDLRSEQMQQRISNLASHSLTTLATLGTSIAGNALGVVMDVLLFLFVLFFVFYDGPEMVARLSRLMPLDLKSNREIIEKLQLTILGVVRGTFLTGLLQGACAAIGFFIVHTEGSVLLGVLTSLASLIPSIGTALVWMPVALVYFLTGHAIKGLFVTLWGILVIGVVDNLARPYIVGSKADMPFLWLFLGILGGLEVFGPLGLLIGPLIMGMIPVLSAIYERRFLPHRSDPKIPTG